MAHAVPLLQATRASRRCRPATPTRAATWRSSPPARASARRCSTTSNGRLVPVADRSRPRRLGGAHRARDRGPPRADPRASAAPKSSTSCPDRASSTSTGSRTSGACPVVDDDGDPPTRRRRSHRPPSSDAAPAAWTRSRCSSSAYGAEAGNLALRSLSRPAACSSAAASRRRSCRRSPTAASCGRFSTRAVPRAARARIPGTVILNADAGLLGRRGCGGDATQDSGSRAKGRTLRAIRPVEPLRPVRQLHVRQRLRVRAGDRATGSTASPARCSAAAAPRGSGSRRDPSPDPG